MTCLGYSLFHALSSNFFHLCSKGTGDSSVVKGGMTFLPDGDYIVCLFQVSVSCGIPDFRSRDGIYARLAVDFPDLPDPQAMFDIHYFRRDPRPFFKFAREIYPGQFTPSLCHR